MPMRTESSTSKSRLELGVQVGERSPHLVGRAHGAQRVVVVDDRDAEDGHHRVADELLDRAAVPLEHGAHLRRSSGPSPAAATSGSSRSPSARRVRDVAEQDGDGLAENGHAPSVRLSLRRSESWKRPELHCGACSTHSQTGSRAPSATSAGRGKLDEEAVSRAMREIRLALLEADVNFKVVKEFVERVRERALGADVPKSLTPGQQVVKIVHEELTDAHGRAATRSSPSRAGRRP